MYILGFFNQVQQPPHSRSSSFIQPPPQARPEVPVERAVDNDGEEDKKLQKVLYALTDLIRTPSDHAQLRAINAIENLAQKGLL